MMKQLQLSLMRHPHANFNFSKSLSPLWRTSFFSRAPSLQAVFRKAVSPNPDCSALGSRDVLWDHEGIRPSSSSSSSSNTYRACFYSKEKMIVPHERSVFSSSLSRTHYLNGFPSGFHSPHFACFSSSSNLQNGLTHIVEVGWDEVLNTREDLEELSIQLQEDGKRVLKEAMEKMEVAEGANAVELSVLLTSDSEIQALNEQWRGEDKPTDVLSFQQDQPPGFNPTLLLGDVVISIDTAERQAQQMGHSLLDELRILMLHGLLHILGYDHENGPAGEKEMKEEEGRIINLLGWKGKGLIENSYADADKNERGNGHATIGNDGQRNEETDVHEQDSENEKKSINSRVKNPNFKFLFCDMDGTLLNSQSKISQNTARALKAAADLGVQIVIATGKTRPAAFSALSSVGLVGDGNILSNKSPGVFLQGLRVYGKKGHIVHNALLPEDICKEGFSFSLKHEIPLIGFSGDDCVTLFDHPLVEKLHTTYYEPRAVVMPSVEAILLHKPVQKLLFYDSPEGIQDFVRPHWSLVTMGRASVTQAVPDMIEILPPGASKGLGVKILLDHLGVDPEQVMALGDGENDLEMIEMVGWGVAMANGSHKTKSVANAVVSSNDDDGVAEAIELYLLN